MGVVAYALSIHRRHEWNGRHAGLSPALAFAAECQRLGAAGMQIALTAQDAEHVRELRRLVDAGQFHFEGIVEPPAASADLDRFETSLRNVREAGGTIARTVIMPGRRYEEFRSMAEFRRAEERGRRSLERAEPLCKRHGVRLAVENHKDHRLEERIALMRQLDSEFIGTCLDFGNNFALLDDPLETVEQLAPWTLTVHIKDHVLQRAPEGFLIADLALGNGFLELGKMVEVIRRARPEAKFNLESITRDAILVPVLADRYWATLGDVTARDLGRTLATVRQHGLGQRPVQVSTLTVDEQLALEESHVQRSVAYARNTLAILPPGQPASVP